MEPISSSRDVFPNHLAQNRHLTRWQKREPGLVQCGQVWLGLDWKEEGEGNMDNGPVCWTMMCRTFMDLPNGITPYHSGMSGWSASKRVRPAGCPGGNEVIGTDFVWSKWSEPCWSNSFASAFDLLFFSTLTQILLLEMTSLIYLRVVFERLHHHRCTLPEVSCSNKAPAHMSILRHSKVWWARSHHAQSCPAFKQ